VLFIDLDHFKIINDSLGHDVGDLLLQEVAARLGATVRGEDTVARQGGDEFIVLLPDISGAQDAGEVARKILDGLMQPYQVNGKELHIGGSIGIALFPHDGEDADTLLKNSDIAMYHAKENGRNNYQFFTPEMNKLAMERHSLGADLRHALEDAMSCCRISSQSLT
jgi:diguanylate cyclase (GGDEF)-like protein